MSFNKFDIKFIYKNSDYKLKLDDSNKFRDKDLSFINIDFNEYSEDNFENLLSGKYDSKLSEIAFRLKDTHYVVILSLKELNTYNQVIKNNLNSKDYSNAFNYISNFIDNHASGTVFFVLETSLVPFNYRSNSNINKLTISKNVNYDFFVLSLKNIDKDLSVSKLNLEAILSTYNLELTRYKSVMLTDIPEYLYSQSFFSELSSSLSHVSGIIASSSFFSFYKIQDSLSLLKAKIKVSFCRVFNVVKSYVFDYKILQGEYNYNGKKDFQLKIMKSDDYIDVHFRDDFLVSRTQSNDFYDKIYLCLSRKLDSGYMIYNKLETFFLVNLNDFSQEDLSIQDISKDIIQIRIKNKDLSLCNDASSIEVYDYDERNEFTHLKYLNTL